MRMFKVTNLEENVSNILTEGLLRAEAEYYYNNSDVLEEIDFSIIENCIDFVRRVDQVEEIFDNE